MNVVFRRMNRNKKQEIIEWYAVADSRECVKVDNSGNGLIRLWQQQICQFPNVGLDVAQSIVSEYNSPQALIEVRLLQVLTYGYCIKFIYMIVLGI